jgi:arginyl-tRNA synthetase
MYRVIQQELQGRIEALLRERYEVTLNKLGVELPPRIELGEMALPVAFELAKRLKKAPRAIAQELQPLLADVDGVAAVEMAGAGYLNIKLDRAAMVRRMAAGEHSVLSGDDFSMVEHTSINPNKAAHVGHLRNAVLGDSFARMLRRDEYKPAWVTGVQNYIDNTGVQVADIVVGVTVLKGLDLDGVREWMSELIETNTRLDYACWELYAEVSRWYDADPAEAAARRQIRLDTLHAIEAGGNDTAEIADGIAMGVLRRHLETMERLGIEYDFLPRESEILHLHFWDEARRLMIERGALYLETEGKNKGCWVMRRAGTSGVPDGVAEGGDAGPDEEAKVIVRSNGTVTYVGKDIAYHLWKFGLLAKDFGYAKFHEYATHTCWISTGDLAASDPAHPVFAKADAIYNVIDSSQSDPQNNVIAALRGMGYTDAADRYTHFSYEKVALTPRCALELGYTIAEEDQARPFIEVSGRKGLGVKADDLIDKLIAAALAQVAERNPELSEEAALKTATQIAVGALRYFMLRFNRNTIIAFDFKDALSFEGETGPYVQYAIVRAANIFRRAGVTEAEALAGLPGAAALAAMLDGEDGAGIWETWLAVSRLTSVLELAISASEPAFLTKYCFQLAQQFNTFYHRFHVLNEADAGRKALLLGTAAVARRELVRALGYLGIEAPEVM